MPEKVFLNDSLVDLENARVSVTDSGLLYGAGLFEMMRSRNGIVFRLQDHLDRLLFSAEALSIVHAYGKEYISDAIHKVLRGERACRCPAAADSDERTPGGVPGAASRPRSRSPRQRLSPYPADYYRAGVMVVLCPFRQNTTDPTHGHQTTSFLPRLLALNLARQRRAAEALWFTQDNRLADASLGQRISREELDPVCSFD